MIAVSIALWALNGWFQGFGAPSSVAGAAMGFIGVFSYVGAGVQENFSARLIESGVSLVDGERVHDFDNAIVFWIACSMVSMLLAACLWQTRVRD